MASARRTILFATQAFGRESVGGLGVSAARIAGHLASDWDMRVIVPAAGLAPHACRRHERAGLTVVEVGAATGETALQHVVDVLDDEAASAVDPVYAAFYCHRLAHAVTLAAALRHQRPVVFARGNDVDLEVFGPYGMHVLHALAAARRVFCVSREMEEKVRAYCPGAVTRYVANGVDTARFVPQPVPTPRARPVVGLFGDVKEKKGLGILLEAFDFRRYDLQLVGSIREESRLLLHGFLTLHPELRDRVVVRPFTAEEATLAGYYGAVDVVCIPSVHEGMANVMLEAFASGRPCVCSAVGGARDAVVDGSNGFLCPPRSAAALASAIDRAVAAVRADPEGLARAARATAERYSAQAEAEHYRREFATLDS